MSNGEVESDELDDGDDSSGLVKCSAHVKLGWAPNTNVTGTTRKNQKASLKSVDVPVMFRKAKGKAVVFTAKVVGIIDDEHGQPIEVVVSEYSLFMNGTTGKLELKSSDKDVSHVPPKFVAELLSKPGHKSVSNSDDEDDEEDDEDDEDDGDDDEDEDLDEEFEEADDDDED